jgi:CheY-like chemotaxis protein
MATRSRGAIRREPTLQDLKLVALTGYGREEDRRAALAAGFDEHLVKPVDLNRPETVLRDLPRGAGSPTRGA